VEIHVLQGERKMAADNRTLGRFTLEGIPPAPRGLPQIEVEFDIDANGIVHVAAKDKATGKEQKIRIEASSGLSETDIDQMVKDAEAHSDEDEKRRAAVDTRNKAENLAYQVEKQIEEMGEKLDAADKASLEEAVSETRKTLEGDDDAKIATQVEELEKIWQEIGARFHTQNAEQAQQGEPGEPGDQQDADAGAGDDAVDADFEVVDD
ncbi:MAG: Hsp70 family protein, partial [Candidatus Sabulitectum sp.]|nr:Hsp70 family protein [Candidatus Sabulitectum sp.]